MGMTQRMASSCVCCGATAVPIVYMRMFDYIMHLGGGGGVSVSSDLGLTSNSLCDICAVFVSERILQSSTSIVLYQVFKNPLLFLWKVLPRFLAATS